MEFCKEDLLVNIFEFMEGFFFHIYCQGKYMVDFLNLQSKLETPTLIKI